MGYYLNTLIKGKLYELNGQRLEFSEKVGKLYYFYRYDYDENTFTYEKTNHSVAFSLKELNFLKRVQECSDFGSLERIGRDKVWQRTN